MSNTVKVYGTLKLTLTNAGRELFILEGKHIWMNTIIKWMGDLYGILQLGHGGLGEKVMGRASLYMDMNNQSAFRKKIYRTIEELQADLDKWMYYYNNERTHSGKHCFGKTPIETLKLTIPLAKEKLLKN